MIIKIGKLMLACLFGLIVYGCAASQLSRSGIDRYDTRPEAGETRRILSPESREALVRIATLADPGPVDREELALMRAELSESPEFYAALSSAFAKWETGRAGSTETERELVQALEDNPAIRRAARQALLEQGGGY